MGTLVRKVRILNDYFSDPSGAATSKTTAICQIWPLSMKILLQLRGNDFIIEYSLEDRSSLEVHFVVFIQRDIINNSRLTRVYFGSSLISPSYYLLKSLLTVLCVTFHYVS